MISPRKKRRLSPQRDRSAARTYNPLKIRDNFRLIKGNTLQYPSGDGRVLNLDVKRGDVSSLPRSPDTAIRLIFREMQGVRGDIHRQLFVPLTSAVRRGTTDRAALIQVINQRMAVLERSLTGRLNDVLDRGARQELREIQLDIKQDKPSAQLKAADQLIRESQTQILRYSSRGASVIRQALERARQDCYEYIDNTDRKRRFQARLYQSHHVPSSGRCLSKGVSRILRTEAQAVRHVMTKAALKDAGYEYVYWRLSSSHKNYGGSEVCEVYAASTGRSVPAATSFSRVGCYRIDEVPMPPHPNCLCSLEVVSGS